MKYGYDINYLSGTWAPFDSKEEAAQEAEKFYREQAAREGWDSADKQDFDKMVYEVEEQ